MRKQSSDEQMEIKIKKKKDEVLKANLWTNKIDDLFSNARPTLKSSRVDGKEPEPVFHSSNTEKLDQWARMLSESLISEKL